MPHQADAAFFDSKRSWSKRKDQILSRYLTPYLAKVNRLGQSIFLIDGFAGAGKYADDTAGSPLLLHSALQRAKLNRPGKLVLIEDDPSLRKRLSTLVAAFPNAEVRPGPFLSNLDYVRSLASRGTVFMYLDPYAVRGLELSALTSVFELVSRDRSVEALINFNAPIFVRWGLAAKGRSGSLHDDPEAGVVPTRPEIAELDRIVGGDWWQEIVEDCTHFPSAVNAVVDGYVSVLRQHFKQVCYHALYHRSSHRVPKYVLVFASRHPDALCLMNDNMAEAHRALLEAEADGQAGLFAPPALAATPAISSIDELLFQLAAQPVERDKLVFQVAAENFGVFVQKEIRSRISDLLRSNRLESETGKTKINGKVKVWARSMT
ncbi:MAG: three-Cys-motif partner protein TcmP [Planctomycetota bacterium]